MSKTEKKSFMNNKMQKISTDTPQKILVTGAKGMLGCDLCHILSDIGHNVIETDSNTLNIVDKKMVNDVLYTERPEIIIHCAAYTNVDAAEEDLTNAHLVNVNGTENLAKSCAQIGATMLYISTDYVFDGTKTSPYEPKDETNPINNYGLTKLYGELSVKSNLNQYYICRTSWLYGYYGKNFVETILSLAKKANIEKKTLKVVNDQVGCPTWTVELSYAIAKILHGKHRQNNLDFSFGTYHLCCGGSATWYDFAKEVLELANIDSSILIPCCTDDFPRLAKRPYYSVMNNHQICRHWKEALKDYMNSRAS